MKAMKHSNRIDPPVVAKSSVACRPYTATVLFAVILALGMSAAPAWAVDNTMTNSGAWTDVTKWSEGHMPTGAENTVIAAGVAASLTTTPSNYTGTLTFGTGSSLLLNAATGGGQWALNYASMVYLGNNSALRLGTATYTKPMTLLGNTLIYSPGDWTTATLSGAISGIGRLQFTGGNGRSLYLAASNSFSGNLLLDGSANNFDVKLQASGAAGTGDVIIPTGQKPRLYVDAANAIADTATLVLNGVNAYVTMNQSDTIGALIVNGVPQAPGAYTSAETFVAGAGTLTVAADVVPPYPSNPMTFSAVPYGVDITTIAMTATEALDYNGVEYQFTNTTDGTASTWQTGRSWTNSGLTEGNTYSYNVRTRDSLGNTGEWSATYSSTPVIENILNGTAWNTAGNWSLGHVVTGFESAVINTGLTVTVSGTPPAYSGHLTLREGAVLGDAASVIPVYPSQMVMHNNAKYQSSTPTTFNCRIELLGAGNFNGYQNWDDFYFNYPISGSGPLIFSGADAIGFHLKTANTFSGGTSISSGNRSLLYGEANDAFSTGNVTIGNKAALVIIASLSDTIDDGATLYLTGAKSTMQTSKVVLSSSETIGKLYIDGNPWPKGIFNSASGLTNSLGEAIISGAGSLTVLYTDIPPAGTLFIIK